MDGMSQKLEQVQAEVNKVIKGKEDVVKKVLAAVIAGGHILMEDIPGVGKTTLATTFAKSMSMHYKRVQFTPDVLPSDILGFSMLSCTMVSYSDPVYTPIFLLFKSSLLLIIFSLFEQPVVINMIDIIINKYLLNLFNIFFPSHII